MSFLVFLRIKLGDNNTPYQPIAPDDEQHVTYEQHEYHTVYYRGVSFHSLCNTDIPFSHFTQRKKTINHLEGVSKLPLDRFISERKYAVSRFPHHRDIIIRTHCFQEKDILASCLTSALQTEVVIVNSVIDLHECF